MRLNQIYLEFQPFYSSIQHWEIPKLWMQDYMITPILALRKGMLRLAF